MWKSALFLFVIVPRVILFNMLTQILDNDDTYDLIFAPNQIDICKLASLNLNFETICQRKMDIPNIEAGNLPYKSLN